MRGNYALITARSGAVVIFFRPIRRGHSATSRGLSSGRDFPRFSALCAAIRAESTKECRDCRPASSLSALFGREFEAGLPRTIFRLKPARGFAACLGRGWRRSAELVVIICLRVSSWALIPVLKRCNSGEECVRGNLVLSECIYTSFVIECLSVV